MGGEGAHGRERGRGTRRASLPLRALRPFRGARLLRLRAGRRFAHLVAVLAGLALAASAWLGGAELDPTSLVSPAPEVRASHAPGGERPAIVPARLRIPARPEPQPASLGKPASVRVVAYGPQGRSAAPAGSIHVTFSGEVDRASVERAFRVEPVTRGSFVWRDERTLVWRPASGLGGGRTYDVSVGGAAADGRRVVSLRWRFRTAPEARRLDGGARPLMTLTFDDDPRTPEAGFALLDALAKYHVRAVLFPTGAWAERNPSFVWRARAEGHLVCNHTYHHADLTSLGDAELRYEIANGAGAGGCDLLRAPYGRTNARVERVASALGYRMYPWNIDSEDWKQRSARAIAMEVLANARPGGVALFHMHGRHTLEALPAIVWGLRSAGYEVGY